MTKNTVDLFHQAETHFFSLLSAKQREYENLTAYLTGAQVPMLNPALIKKTNNTFLENLKACEAHYAKHHIPLTLVLPDYLSTPTIENLLLQQGFELTGKGVAMTLSLNTFQLPPLEPLLIVKAMKEEMPTWSIPLRGGFESSLETTDAYTARHLLACQMKDKFHHFSGFIKDIAICSLSLSVCGDNVRIDDVATLPDHQKQGYATYLIYAALKQAKQLQAKSCFLEASDSGLTIYKKIGFQPLFINHYYEKISSDNLTVLIK